MIHHNCAIQILIYLSIKGEVVVYHGDQNRRERNITTTMIFYQLFLTIMQIALQLLNSPSSLSHYYLYMTN